MNRLPLLFLLLILVPISWAAETPLPPDAQSAIADYDTKVSKLKGELVAKLQKAQDAATKKGNLDGALAIKGKIGTLGVDNEDMLGAAPVAPVDPGIVVGMWQLAMIGSNYKSLWTFDKKGTVTNSEGNTGKYTILDSTVTITWVTGTVEHMTLPAKGAKATTGVSVNNVPLTFTKQ